MTGPRLTPPIIAKLLFIALCVAGAVGVGWLLNLGGSR
jgi:hypothetical protein